MKKVFAVEPYTEPGRPIFKIYAYNAWKSLGGSVKPSHIPWRIFHHFAFRYQLPVFYHNDTEARLRFIQPISINFDTFPDHAQYEIIPFVWDCWPGVFEKTCKWFIKNKIRTAIFTSSQTAALMKDRFPNMNILAVTEGIDTNVYNGGMPLKDRKTDILIYGRPIKNIIDHHFPANLSTYRLGGLKGKKLIHTQADLVEKLSDTRIVFAFPQSLTNPEQAGNIETLTQRYWEGMLSRCVMIGHAPNELVNLLGYNPIIEYSKGNQNEQISEIIDNIESYQSKVDKNREMALKFGNWNFSVNKLMSFLKDCGYTI